MAGGPSLNFSNGWEAVIRSSRLNDAMADLPPGAFDDSTAIASPVGGIMTKDPINILLVDDQPAKLLSYEAILQGLGENLIKAGSAREALEQLLKEDIAIVLSDVCMPELDGFELARMIRNHPRFQHTAIIFISAVALTDPDRVPTSSLA